MKRLACCVCFAGLAASAAVHAQSVVFSDGFNLATPLSANWTVAQQPDTFVSLVDYSSLNLQTLFGVGSGTLLSIPEAPTSIIVGGPASTGVVFAANVSSGAAVAANLISKATFDLPVFEFQYDVYMSSASAALVANNGTEVTLWGVGRTNVTAFGYGNRLTDGNGTWGWLAGENGFGTEDSAVFRDTTELIDIGDTADPGAADLFNQAFTSSGPTNDWPLFDWVTVNIAYKGGNLSVEYNGVEFFNVATSQPAGRLMVGYGDPFASISSSPNRQFGVIDNVLLLIPEPNSLMLSILAVAPMLPVFRRRNAVAE